MLNKLRVFDKYFECFPLTSTMPVLFIGHGSPMNAIEENEFTKGIRQIGSTIPLPKAILCISAHWYIRGTKVTAMEYPQTIHDFYGFPRKLFEVQYPAKGDVGLADFATKLLEPYPVETNFDWGLDHGAWSVLLHLFPNANIPVVQLSIDNTKGPEYHFELARRLNELRSRGVLILGSGNIIHNLGLIDWNSFDKENFGYDWALESRAWVNNNILHRNFGAIINYRMQGRAMQLAVPSPDHYLPLIYALGVADENENIEIFNDKLQAGSLSMTSIKIG